MSTKVNLCRQRSIVTVTIMGFLLMVTFTAHSTTGRIVRGYNVNFDLFTCDELQDGKSVSEIFHALQEKLGECKQTKLSDVIIKISCGSDKFLFTTTKEGCEYALRIREKGGVRNGSR
jgi:hypothetical protein